MVLRDLQNACRTDDPLFTWKLYKEKLLGKEWPVPIQMPGDKNSFKDSDTGKVTVQEVTRTLHLDKNKGDYVTVTLIQNGKVVKSFVVKEGVVGFKGDEGGWDMFEWADA